MAVFFELSTDTFKERFDRVGGGAESLRAGAPSARRPLRGLEVKEDTFAMLKVIDIMGREIKLYNSSHPSGKSSSTTNFILQSVQEPRSEKFQLVETFGDPYIFLYGESPRLLTCTSILIDSLDFNWQAEFWANYDKYLRGSKCAENGARVYLFYSDNIVEGYMIKAAAMNESMNPMAVQMQFEIFVTNYRNISMIGDPKFPIRLGVTIDTSAPRSDYTGRPSGLPPGEGPPASLRSNISDNTDEWTGEPPNFAEEEDNTAEIDDLIRAAVEEAAKNAANMNSVDSIADANLDRANGGSGGGASPPEKPSTSTVPPCDPTISSCLEDPNAPCGGKPMSCMPPPAGPPSSGPMTPAEAGATTAQVMSNAQRTSEALARSEKNEQEANAAVDKANKKYYSSQQSTNANSSTVLPECTASGQTGCRTPGT